MCDIEMQDMSPELFECWTADADHLSDQVDGRIQSWLRANTYPLYQAGSIKTLPALYEYSAVFSG